MTAVTTGDIDVTASVATQLALESQPPLSVVAGKSFGFTVVAQDSSGAADLDFDGEVTVALSGEPAGAVLGASSRSRPFAESPLSPD